MPDKKELFTIFQKSVEMFYARDADLLRRAAHEQAMAHRIAHYLECLLMIRMPVLFTSNGLSVDCEYNKAGDDVKRIGSDHARPDIIVHRRGNHDFNHLVIEIKKAEGLKSSEREEDYLKLQEFTCESNEEYRYVTGIYLELAEKAAKVIQFEKGIKSIPPLVYSADGEWS